MSNVIRNSSGSSSVVTPLTSTDNAVVRFDGTGGSTLQNSQFIVGDTGNTELISSTSSRNVDAPTLSLLAYLTPGGFFGGVKIVAPYSGAGSGAHHMDFYTQDGGTVFGKRVRISDEGTVTIYTPNSGNALNINGGVGGTAIDTDGTLAANSDTILASQKATKTYVDTQITAIGAEDMFKNYAKTDIDTAGTTTYLGYCKPNSNTWLMKKIVDNTGGDYTITWANVGNNGAVTTYASAWTNRATLTYAAIGSLTI